MIISVVNHKGGVGKTTTTHNLGKALSLEGKKVLLIDLDPQANLSQASGVETPNASIYKSLCENEDLFVVNLDKNLDLIPAEINLAEAEIRLQADVNGYFRLRTLLKNILPKYDFILIDCPPSLGILTLNALIASQKAIVVVQAEYLAVKGLQTIFDLIIKLQENLNPNIEILGMLLTQLNHTIFRKEIADTVRNIYEGKVFENGIRQNITLAEATSAGQDVFAFDKHCTGAKDYKALALEILGMLQ
jgi:chromosome partitioning protein